MDQAALGTLNGENTEIIFAMDRTKKLLNHEDPVWVSKTFIRRAFDSFEPIAENVVEASRSIAAHALKNLACIPLRKNPNLFIFLASKRDPLRTFSAEELLRYKVAAKASVLALEQHGRLQALRERNEKLTKIATAQESRCVYVSPKIERLIEEVAQIAPFNLTILIQGESGTGKEELAREIHKLSGRTGPFIVVNCANLTENLLESELFGYEKGAFTGASSSKRGLLFEAQRGTVLLDELAELPFGLQAKLLRTLQERSVRPLGGTQDFPIDVRFLAATHRPLMTAVVEKQFREDLFYRVAEYTVILPPLRDRLEDIEPLATHFLDLFQRELKLPARSLVPQTLQKLKTHSWPGNVRELKSVLRTAAILSRTQEIQAHDVRIVNPPPKPQIRSEPIPMEAEKISLKDLTEKYERDLVQDLLSKPGATQSGVAEKLGVSVRTVQRILSDLPQSSWTKITTTV